MEVRVKVKGSYLPAIRPSYLDPSGEGAQCPDLYFTLPTCGDCLPFAPDVGYDVDELKALENAIERDAYAAHHASVYGEVVL